MALQVPTKALLRAFRAVLLLAVFVLSVVSTFLPLPRFDLALLSITQTSTGPTVYIGLLGSCTRYYPSALKICTGPTIPPQFDTSVLSALSTKTQAHVQAHLAIKFGAPNLATAAAVSIGHILVTISTPLIAVPVNVPSSRRRPWIHPVALLGIPGAVLPLLITIHLRLMFDVAIKIFNASQGQFVLRTGKLWILMMVCYGLLVAAALASRFWPTEDPNDRDAETLPFERAPSERPPSERPPSERPPSERPPSERPPSERPPSERPPSERPPSERPSSEISWPTAIKRLEKDFNLQPLFSPPSPPLPVVPTPPLPVVPTPIDTYPRVMHQAVRLSVVSGRGAVYSAG